jgi:hypothetical protein
MKVMAAMVIFPAITHIPASKGGITEDIPAAFTIRNLIIKNITGIITIKKKITDITKSALLKISTFQNTTFDPIQRKSTINTATVPTARDIMDGAISTGDVSVLTVAKAAPSMQQMQSFFS